MGYNQIKIISDGLLKLTNLKTLDLSDNKLESFPENISSLRKLSIFCFDLVDRILPELPHIDKLFVFGNRESPCANSIDEYNELRNEQIERFNRNRKKSARQIRE